MIPITMPSTPPQVPYKAPGTEYWQFVDINQRLYRDRILVLGNYINDEAANQLISILLYLRKEDASKPITLYCNFPGGALRPVMALYDTINECKKTGIEFTTLNMGLANGMGAFLCGAGTKGKRYALPNARYLLQRTGIDQGFRGQATDIALEVKSIKRQNDNLEGLLASMTGQPLGKLQKDMKRDFYLSSEEAVEYGICDHVLQPSGSQVSERSEVPSCYKRNISLQN